MWNYSFVLPNLIVLAVFLIYYSSRPQLPLYITKLFPKVLLTEVLVILLDPLASICLENCDDFSLFFQKSMNVLYFMAFIFRIYIFYVLTTHFIKIHHKKVFPLFIVSLSVLLFGEMIALLNLKWPIIFSMTEGTYKREKFYDLIYLIALYYHLVSFCLIYFQRKKVEKWRTFNTFLFNFIILAGYITRFSLKNWLIIDSFYLLSIIIIYTKIESPSLYLDGKTFLFNTNALTDILEEAEGTKTKLLMGFRIRNYQDLRDIFSTRQMDSGIKMISLYLKKNYQKLTKFYAGDGIFLLTGEDGSSYKKIKSEISQRFKKSWTDGKDFDISMNVDFFQANPDILLKDSSIMMKALSVSLIESKLKNEKEIIITDDTLKEIVAKLEIKRALEHAVETKSFQLYLQPIVDAKTHKVTGAESLARLCDFNGKIISPELFIPIAERNGRINALGEDMLEKTCAFIKKHDIKKHGISWININLSPIQFLNSELNERFCKILKKFNLDAELLHLEITEEAMIDHAMIQNQIQTMQDTGFKFVLDDYGKGYSNISRLKRCPFINVKLDMELVWDFFKTNDCFLPMMVKTFKLMNFMVTAEGIETEEMADKMRELGCDYLQGYYFSKPLSAEEFATKYLSES